VNGISTQVLDTVAGRPAAGLAVSLDHQDTHGNWRAVRTTATDADGRVDALLPEGTPLAAGTYRLVFATGAYFAGSGSHPEVVVLFTVTDPDAQHDVPLLLGPSGYTTAVARLSG
jgi:5-hydroxyisourate hydrolase